MSKRENLFVCYECGASQSKWSGQCNSCGCWGSLSEEKSNLTQFSLGKKVRGNNDNVEYFDLNGQSEAVIRFSTSINELDRVLGGGLVSGSAILIGGDPGVGKSTLLLQVACVLTKKAKKVYYISGEESIDQIRLRARRLNISDADLKLASATCVNDIIASLKGKNCPDIVVIDSIQTMFVSEIASAPGTVSQVRAACYDLISFAKSNNVCLLIIGHVTKDGQIAGPKLLEHMVDTVIYFEGDRGHQFRILRSIKNRFGPTNEIGVFSMENAGLVEVTNPSSLFLSTNESSVSGSVVFAGIEGTRPVLVEIQALVSPTTMPTPRRAVVGWDNNRLAMIIAILHSRYGLFIADKEVYLNVAGGLKINEPAADLAVAVALISSVSMLAIPKQFIIFGELALSGEVRNVSQSDVRIKESQKLGFTSALLPNLAKNENNSFILHKLKHIRELKNFFQLLAKSN